MTNNDRLTRMHTILKAALTPTKLEIVDESDAHIGHKGARSGAGHYAVQIASPQFKDKSLVQCHRLVYAALDEMMHTEIHALKIQIMPME